jgi:monoamine oxidase
MKSMPSNPDTIVIGAGAAGLSAAKELARLGLTCVVIEGTHRIGGRAHSQEIAPGIWFDLGCAWLVGGAANPFTHIAESLGIALSKEKRAAFTLAEHRFVRNGAMLDADERAACLRFYRDSLDRIAAAARRNRDVALSDVVDADSAFALPFMGAVATAWGLDTDRVSTVDFASAAGENEYQVFRGYGTLIATWGADVPVSLDTPAERIDWAGDSIRVDTPKGTLSARTVLITVSTGVLAHGDIGFTPALPPWKLDAIDALPMGTENKIGLHFERDIFGPHGRGYYTTWRDGETAAKVDAGVMGLNTAVVLVGGRQAIGLEREGPEALSEFALDRVADIFGNDIRKHAGRAIPTAWHSEPRARGSWACAEPGQAHQRAALARPVDDRLFFAGEATLYESQGTCHGAYQSGIRAAREIAEKVATHA